LALTKFSMLSGSHMHAHRLYDAYRQLLTCSSVI